MARTNILFPVEGINRELDFRLMLAVLAASPDRRIFIANHWVFDKIVEKMQGGLYLGKNFVSGIFPHGRMDRYHQLKARGINVVFLDEEGSFYAGGDDQWRLWLGRRLDPNVLDDDDFVCTWGDYQTRYYKEHTTARRDRVRTTGHPRFDLYKPEYRAFFEADARALREEYGRFVLVNTNMPYGRHAHGPEYVFRRLENEGADDPEWRHDLLDLWAVHSIKLANFVRMTFRLAEDHPDLTIIVRPHPGADWDYYRMVFRSLPNVLVRHEGPVGPWILGSEAMIHDGCTTAVEAYLAHRPIIRFPAGPDRDREKIPNMFGVRRETPEEVSETVGDILSGDFVVEDPMTEMARDRFHNFGNDSVRPTLDVLDEAEEQLGDDRYSPSAMELFPGEARRSLEATLKKPIRRLFLPDKQRRFEAASNRFPGFDRQTIARKLTLLQELFDRRVDFTYVNQWLVVVDG